MTAPLHDAPAAVAAPRGPRPEPSRLGASDRQAVDAIFEAARAARPGCALAVTVARGRTVHSRSAGARHRGSEPVTDRTPLPICSVSKVLTAVAVLRLAERGVLDLDRPVAAYLDGRLPARHGLTDGVTLRRLLSHTAGFARWYPPAPPAADLGAYVRRVLPTHPRLAAPGVIHDYSNFGVQLAGYVAEVAAGRPFAEVVREHVLAPLDMPHTTFRHGAGAASPAGGAVSTGRDLAHLARMLLDGGRFRGRPVLRPASWEAMTTLHAPLYLPDHAARGLALRLDTYKDVRRAGHAGRGRAAASRLRLALDDGLAVVLLAQGPDPQALDRALTEIERRLFDALLDLPEEAPRPPLAPGRARRQRAAGTYVGHEQGLAHVEDVGGALVLTWRGTRTPLRALGDDTRENAVYVGPGGEGPAVGFVEAEGEPPFLMVDGRPLRRVPRAEGDAPDAASLRPFAGRYRHPTLGRARVFVREDRLCVGFDWLGGWLPLRPLAPKRFAGRLGLVEFEESAGEVSAFTFRDGCLFRRLAQPTALFHGPRDPS